MSSQYGREEGGGGHSVMHSFMHCPSSLTHAPTGGGLPGLPMGLAGAAPLGARTGPAGRWMPLVRSCA